MVGTTLTSPIQFSPELITAFKQLFKGNLAGQGGLYCETKSQMFLESWDQIFAKWFSVLYTHSKEPSTYHFFDDLFEVFPHSLKLIDTPNKNYPKIIAGLF